MLRKKSFDLQRKTTLGNHTILKAVCNLLEYAQNFRWRWEIFESLWKFSNDLWNICGTSDGCRQPFRIFLFL